MPLMILLVLLISLCCCCRCCCGNEKKKAKIAEKKLAEKSMKPPQIVVKEPTKKKSILKANPTDFSSVDNGKIAKHEDEKPENYVRVDKVLQFCHVCKSRFHLSVTRDTVYLLLSTFGFFVSKIDL